VRPAGVRGHPEYVLCFVFVRGFGIGPGIVALTGKDFGSMLLEGVGNIFEEDKAEDDVFVFRRVHVVSQLVGGEPELRLEAQIGSGVSGFGRCFSNHGHP